MDYRAVFAFFVVLTLILYWMRSKTNFFGFINRQAIMGVISTLVFLGTIGSFAVMMFDFDPRPLMRQLGYIMGGTELVNYGASIPPNLTDTVNVKDVMRIDTDNDSFDEWMVFYGQDSQISAVIYDNDRGNPPVIYPYSLRPPNNDYLSDGDYAVSQDYLTSDNIRDIFIKGYPNMPFGIPIGSQATDLTIFRLRDEIPTGNPLDPPSDNPSRYVPVGRFHGDGGVTIDMGSKNVTVITKGSYDRSQLALRQVYVLDSEKKSYMDRSDPTKLGQPSVTTLDFYPDPPSEIVNAPFPEQVVLAFYAASCFTTKDDLCRHADQGWNAKEFLSLDSDAEATKEYNAGNFVDYFGLPGATISSLSVSSLNFSGEQPDQMSMVDITFVTNSPDQQIQTARYLLRFSENKWKIVQRVKLEAATLGQP